MSFIRRSMSIWRTSQDEEAAPSTAGSEKASKMLEPSTKWTAHQIFYVFGLDGFGALLISGGINFAIAYGMYTTQDISRNPIRLFELPNTLAGDAAVTIIIQSLVTWLIELLLVNHDMSTGGVQPIGFVAEPTGRLLRWLFMLDRDESATRDAKYWVSYVFQNALRAFMIAVVGFILTWGPSVGILTTVGEKRGGDWYFEKLWAPQLFKLVLGGVLALFTTPPMAFFWLVRAGWLAKKEEAESAEAT